MSYEEVISLVESLNMHGYCKVEVEYYLHEHTKASEMAIKEAVGDFFGN